MPEAGGGDGINENGCLVQCKAFLAKIVEDFTVNGAPDGEWSAEGDVVSFKVAATQAEPPAPEMASN